MDYDATAMYESFLGFLAFKFASVPFLIRFAPFALSVTSRLMHLDLVQPSAYYLPSLP